MVVWDDIGISAMAFAVYVGCFTQMVVIMPMKMDLAWRMTMRRISTVSSTAIFVLSFLGNQ